MKLVIASCLISLGCSTGAGTIGRGGKMKTLTSADSPILVAFAATDLPGRIGLTFAPGKKGPGIEVNWDRDLEADLTRLREVYKVDLLVTLIVKEEFDHLKIPDLFERAHAHGIETEWFPIGDGGVPSSMDAFVMLIEKILAKAREGKTVVVHCRGGLGRAGLTASACLVALGKSPADAIAAVRAVRRGAVETKKQEMWVEEFGEVWRSIFDNLTHYVR